MSALLALFVRSLRLHVRSRAVAVTHAGLVGFILLLLFVSHGTASAVGAPGLSFFKWVMLLNLAVLTLAAVSYFASAITEEKEEGTLGLLQMTNLDPLAILLGKSTTRLCGALLLLLVQVPFTLLAVTLGGISVHQIVAAYATVGAYTFFLANLALLASVLAPRTSVASLLTGGFIFLFPAFVLAMQSAPALAALPHLRGKADAAAALLAHWGKALAEASPFERLGEVFVTGFSGSALSWQIWSNLGGGLICFVLAWALFDVTSGERRLFASGRLVPRADSRFARFAPERPWLISAIAWKDFHFLHGGRLVMIVKSVVYAALCAWLIWYEFRAFQGFSAAVAANVATPAARFASAASGIASWMFFALAIELGVIGSRILQDEVRNKTLTGLAGLPFAMKHIVLMKIDGAKRALYPVLCGLVLAAVGAFCALAMNPGNASMSVLFAGLVVGYVWTQIWLFAHVTARLSLRMRWGALPLSFAVCFFGNLAGMIMCIGIFLAPIVALILVPTLRESIYSRLEALAAED